MSGAQRTGSTQTGAVLVGLALGAATLLAVVALAVDGFLLMAAWNDQRANAGFAALAGLKAYMEVPELSVSARVRVATGRAEQVAGSNRYTFTDGSPEAGPGELMSRAAGELTFGTWDKDSETFSPVVNDHWEYDALRLELRTPARSLYRTVFARLAGLREVEFRSVAIAYYDPTEAAAGRPALVLIYP